MKYIRKFETDSEYQASKTQLEELGVYLSYTQQTDNTVLYYEKPKQKLVAYFNVAYQNSEGTKILYNPANVSEIEIDGVKQQNVVNYYKFNTLGEHVVKYTLTDQTQISDNMFSFVDFHLYKVIIPDGVTSIGDQAFQSCYDLKQVIMPNTVTSIGYMAFQGTDLRDGVQWSDHLTTIGNQAFSGIYLGKNQNGVVQLPNSVITIGERAFQRLDYMTQMYVGSNVTTIGLNAFGTNSGMVNFYINAETPPTIGSNLFYNHGNNFTIFVPAASVNAYKTASGWSDYTSFIQAN